MTREEKFPRPFRGAEEDGRDYQYSLSNREEWWGSAEEIKDVMEHFCWLVKHKEPIPRDIQVFIATAFWKYLVKNQDLEKAFRLKEERTGRKKLPPPDGRYIPQHVIDIGLELSTKDYLQINLNLFILISIILVKRHLLTMLNILEYMGLVK